MSSNGTQQSALYQLRGGVSDGNSNRNRSMEQQYGGPGNPYMPWNTSGPGQTGSGGQSYNYGRYVPPTMTGFNNNVWNNQGPYSYNTPNSYGSNYGGGNFYTPYQSSAYGGGSPGQNPLSLFGRGNFPSFSNSQGGQPPAMGYGYQGPQSGGSGMAYGSGQGYGANMPQLGYNKPWGEQGGQQSLWANANGALEQMYKPGMNGGTKPYQEGGNIGFPNLPSWAQSPSRDVYDGSRFGRQPANPDGRYTATSAPSQPFSQSFAQFLRMGY